MSGLTLPIHKPKALSTSETISGMSSTSYTSTQPPAACYFFCLPPELRCMVYAYALSESKGLRYLKVEVKRGKSTTHSFHLTVRSAIKSDQSTEDANQLKFVNMQLYAETRGLGIQHSDIYFADFEDTVLFLDSYPKIKHRFLRIIHIDNGNYPPPRRDTRLAAAKTRYTDGLADKLVTLCREHPKVLLRARNLDWSLLQSHFFREALLVQLRVHASLDLIPRFFSDPWHQEEVAAWCLRHCNLESITDMSAAAPPNFRYYPREETFDETAIRAFIEEEVALLLTIITGAHGHVDHWVATMRDCFENGV